HVLEAGELQDLTEAVLRERVEVVDVVREVLRADEGIRAVQAIHEHESSGTQRLAAQRQKLDLLVERQMVELLLGDDHIERLRARLDELERAGGAAVELSLHAVSDLLRIRV